MAAEFSFDGTAVHSVIKDIAHNMAKIKEFRKEYTGLLAAIVFRDVVKHFEEEKGPKGSWEPWSDVYRKRLEMIGRDGNKILQFNGRLRQTFKPTNFKTMADAIYWFNNAKTKGGYPYAWGHDEGDGKLPQREFMYLSGEAMEDIIDNTLKFAVSKGI